MQKGLNYYSFKEIQPRKHKKKVYLKTWLSTFNSFALSQPSLETFSYRHTRDASGVNRLFREKDDSRTFLTTEPCLGGLGKFQSGMPHLSK